jgi:hypothetical protein
MKATPMQQLSIPSTGSAGGGVDPSSGYSKAVENAIKEVTHILNPQMA